MNTEKRTLSYESPERLHRLTDIVFAVSMVLFIVTGMLSAKDPDYWVAYEQDPGKFVLERAYELLTSFLVFLFMAIYWITNSTQSKYFIKVDSTYTWITILYLFFIALAPFPNALSIQYGNDFYVQIFFGMVMFFIGILSFLSWFYASTNHRLIRQDISNTEIRSVKRALAVEPLVALISILASLISTALWEPSLLLLPIGIVIITMINKREMKKIVSTG